LSLKRFYRTLEVIYNLVKSGCEISPAPQLPDDIRSASFILNYESYHAQARDKLRERSRSTPVYWVHDEDYYARTLRGSADTLEALRQLPNRYNGVFGSFVPFPANRS
jgi:hypothetical protein